MKKNAAEELDRKPRELSRKLEEMKEVKAEIHEAVKSAQVRETKGIDARLKSWAKETSNAVLKAGVLPFSLRLKRTHSLGDFYGRFHPSKSKKGIKRSEQ